MGARMMELINELLQGYDLDCSPKLAHSYSKSSKHPTVNFNENSLQCWLLINVRSIVPVDSRRSERSRYGVSYNSSQSVFLTPYDQQRATGLMRSTGI